MYRIYLYPITKRGRTDFVNPYVQNLSKALSAHHIVLNKDRPSGSGILDIIGYLNRIDMVYLNWIEDLPDKHRGVIQSIIFILLMGFMKLSGKKIIWTLHNKTSHFEKNRFLKSILFKLMLNHSDLVITHATDGLTVVPDSTAKIYFPHPVHFINRSSNKPESKNYDMIIWGSVNKYKGVDSFLHFLIENDLADTFKILIAGKIAGSDLRIKLENIRSEHRNITLLDRFVEEIELSRLINSSKIILFCYHEGSVLSSGALMESLQYGPAIVGPDVGAFKDLSGKGLIHAYKDYADLIRIIEDLLDPSIEKKDNAHQIDAFVMENTWDSFSHRIAGILDQI